MFLSLGIRFLVQPVRNRAGMSKLITFSLILLGAASLGFGVRSTSAATDEYWSGSREMKQQAVELYPSLSERQVGALFAGYATERPDGNFEVVNTISLPPEGDADGYTERSVSLVWNGKGYIIAQSVDGESFTPLSR